MSEPILRISPKKYNGETTIISMRLAKDLVKDIDAIANVTGRNRNEILTMSLEFALNHMEIVMKERESLKHFNLSTIPKRAQKAKPSKWRLFGSIGTK